MTELQDIGLGAAAIFRLLDLEPRLRTEPEDGLPPADRCEDGSEGILRLEKVSFTYPHGELPVLSEVSLCARRGEMIVIVGENGAGKSTLAKLMCRLYDPQAGRISWNGVDVRSMHIEDWYGRLAVVHQDFARFPVTFRENVGFGRVAHVDDDEQITRAADSAGLAHVLTRFPHGLDTALTKQLENGTEPSGGQWQRIAIARALMRSEDSEILIVDEPTAALDPKAEHDVFRLLRSVARDRVAVVISHRLALAREADQVVVLEQGRIVEHGTHDVLMARHGVYHTLFTRQASSYLENKEDR